MKFWSLIYIYKSFSDINLLSHNPRPYCVHHLKFPRVYSAKPRLTYNYFNAVLYGRLIQQTIGVLSKEVQGEGVS
jgi:hypothetical protein